MTSREIAELTGKEHKNVMADIRNMFDAIGIQSAEFLADYKDVLYDIRNMFNVLNLSTAEFSAMYKADNGQFYEMFNLPKDLTLTLVSGSAPSPRTAKVGSA